MSNVSQQTKLTKWSTQFLMLLFWKTICVFSCIKTYWKLLNNPNLVTDKSNTQDTSSVSSAGDTDSTTEQDIDDELIEEFESKHSQLKAGMIETTLTQLTSNAENVTQYKRFKEIQNCYRKRQTTQKTFFGKLWKYLHPHEDLSPTIKNPP